MHEFLSLLVSFLIMAIADSIDVAFGNNISIDSVVVIGCAVSFLSVVQSATRIGAYSYRIMRVEESKCLFVDLILGFLTGFLVLIFKDTIVNLYSITYEQKELFKKLLSTFIIYIPCHFIGNACFEMIRLKGDLKFYRKCMVIFYSLLISSDAIIYFTLKNLALMYVFTALCQMVIVIMFLCKYKVKYKKIDKNFINNAVKYGLPVCAERLLNGVCLMSYGVMASKMGNINFAIHSVLYGSIYNAEQVTNAYNSAMMIVLPLNKGYEETKNNLKSWSMRLFPIMLVAYICYSMVSIFIYRGKVDLYSCFPWFFFYMLEFFGLFVYENSKVLTINQKVCKFLPFGCILGFAFRMTISYIGIIIKIPLAFFGIGLMCDWAIRGMFYGTTLRLHIKTKKF